MMTIPLTSDGARTVTVETGTNLLTFRTYYSYGQESDWLLDISDVDGNALITGMKLTPGSNSVIKGHGDTLEEYQLYVLLMEGTATSINAPGNNLYLILYLPGEENLYRAQDPMDLIGKRQLV